VADQGQIPARLSEDELIARWLAPLAGPAGLGLKDDAALLAPPQGCELILTVDALVSGVHFFPDDPPASIARKVMGVNLSDLAAKGADPLGFLLALMLPGDVQTDWLKAFIEALGEAAKAAHCPLIGGDTTRINGPLALSLTALGSVPQGQMVARTGARPNDLIAVTGTIGDAALGLMLNFPDCPEALKDLSDADQAFLRDRYRHPQPRNQFAKALRRYAHAGMDVSDGLLGDCRKMLKASGCGGALVIDKVPLSDAVARAVARDPRLLERAVTGGDDYEILLTRSDANYPALKAEADALGLPVTVIGSVSASNDVVFSLEGRAMNVTHGSFQHF
jgi:thiamine-monophosphate kinase